MGRDLWVYILVRGDDKDGNSGDSDGDGDSEARGECMTSITISRRNGTLGEVNNDKMSVEDALDVVAGWIIRAKETEDECEREDILKAVA